MQVKVNIIHFSKIKVHKETFDIEMPSLPKVGDRIKVPGNDKEYVVTTMTGNMATCGVKEPLLVTFQHDLKKMKH